MANYKNLYMRYMGEQGIKYTDVRDYVVKVVYTGDKLKTIPVFVYFDEDGEPLVCLKCWEIANFKGKMEAGYATCNALNKKYRWVKFYLDDDCDVVAQIDAYIDAETCGSECVNLVKRVVNIVDEAYPVFMRALYA